MVPTTEGVTALPLEGIIVAPSLTVNALTPSALNQSQSSKFPRSW
jgi:hypothetical protein